MPIIMKSGYEYGGGSGGSEVEPNPSGTPTENLQSLGIDGQIYAVTGTEVVANPTDTATATLEKLKVDGTTYEVPNTEVIPNPQGTPTAVLEKIGINGTIYESGGGTDVEANPSGTPTDALTSLGINTDIYYVSAGRDLTKAQYDALPSSKLTDNVDYYITDVNGDGQYFQPVIYSTEEQEIGVYVDGKPLYQKTLSFTTGSANTYITVAHNISNVDIIWCTADSFVRHNDLSFFLSAYTGATYDNDFVGLVGATTFDYRVGVNLAGEPGTVTLRYTKSTDAPSSGTWTPQGIPAHHYSTEERVVGTWVDGKTLYERTLYLASATISSGSFATMPSIGGIETVMVVGGSVYDTNDQRYYPLPYTRATDSESIKVQSHVANGSLATVVFTNQSGSYSLSDIYVVVQYTKSSL